VVEAQVLSGVKKPMGDAVLKTDSTAEISKGFP
jgi:hypothetical protein